MGMKAAGIWILYAGVALTQDAKPDPPGAEAQTRAEKQVRDVFKDEYAVKSPAAQRKLAKQLLDQGRETIDDLTTQYVLYREAADLAIRSGDVDVLVSSLDSISKSFAVDALNLRGSSLMRADGAIVTPEDSKKLVQALLGVTRDAAVQEQFDLALKTAQVALGTAKKTRDILIATTAEGAVKSVQEAKGSSERSKKAEDHLKTNSEDPSANQAVGEYLCFIRDQWDKGLVFLSKGSDSVLKTLATKELTQQAELSARIGVADEWWDLGTGEKPSIKKTAVLGHAQSLYEADLPKASGLLRAKLEMRLGQKSPPGLLSVAPRANRTGLVAWWKCDEGMGTSVANSVGPGNVATLMNGVGWVTGRSGKALKFDGKGGYLACSAENLPATNAPQTISFWINVSSLPEKGEDVLCFSNDGCTGAIQAGVSATGIAFWKFAGGLLGKAPPPGKEAWHHYALVSDGKTQFVYRDGKLESKTEGQPQAVPVTKCEFGRYRGPGGEDHYFSGALDEIRIYNRPLTSLEVEGLASGNE